MADNSEEDRPELVRKNGLEVEEDLLRPETLPEHFVPMHSCDVVEYLVQHPSLPREDVDRFRMLAKLILAMLHQTNRERHERLTHEYDALDPDCDRILLSVPTDNARREQVTSVQQQIQRELGRANYHRLDEEDIRRALNAASQWGVRMRVDFETMEILEVYARGRMDAERKFRSWKNLYREKAVKVPLYQRLVVVFQIKADARSDRFDARKVYLRMFKNVPQQDVDMMLPASGIQMTWVDHSKIVVPSLYAAGMTLWRFARNVLIWAFFGVFKTVGLVVLVALALGFGVKSMFNYRTATQRRYMLNMTQSLYYQNLDNNGGVLLRLLDEGEQQEASESILCYFVAAYVFKGRPATLDEIDEGCEDLLKSMSGIDIDFDVHDAADKLSMLGIASVAASGECSIKPIDKALQLLDTKWDNWFAPAK